MSDEQRKAIEDQIALHTERLKTEGDPEVAASIQQIIDTHKKQIETGSTVIEQPLIGAKVKEKADESTSSLKDSIDALNETLKEILALRKKDREESEPVLTEQK